MERYFLAAWFQTHRRPRKRAADSAALGFFESVRAGRACTNVQRRDCWKQVNFAAVHVAHGLARSKVEAILPAAKLVASRLNLTIPKGLANSPWRTMPPCDWGAAMEVGFLPNPPVGAALRRKVRPRARPKAPCLAYLATRASMSPRSEAGEVVLL